MNSELKSVAFTSRARQSTHRDGFTLMELLVVIATTGILVLIVFPTLGFSKAKPQAVECLSHFEQLAKACAMYTSDNQEFYPPNPDDGNMVPGYDWCPGNVSGLSPDASNEMYLTNSTYSSLARYLGSSAVPFKCPADWRVGLYNGKVVPVVRSVSANAGVGTVDTSWLSGGSHSGRPTTPAPGPWLTGNRSETQSRYATFGKPTSFRNCSPSDIWIYADEDPFSINDSNMSVVAAVPEIIDFPSTRHQNAGGFGFCDGHAEMHRWKSNLMLLSANPSMRTALPGVQTQDWFWFAWHATRSFTTGTIP